jgi:phage-related protein
MPGEGFKIADGFVAVHADTSDMDTTVNERLRDAKGRFIKAGQESGKGYGDGLEGGVREGVDGVTRDVNGRLRDARGRFLFEGKGAGKDFGDGVDKESRSGLERFYNNVNKRAKDASQEIDKGVGKFVGSIHLMGAAMSGLKWTSMSLGAIAATNSVLNLAAALAPAAGIVAGFPALLATAATGLITMKVATSGMGDALKAALNPAKGKQYEAALKNLAPAAASVVKEFHALVPEFEGVKKAVQQALFAPLQGQLTAIAKVMAGPVKLGMSGVAAAFGDGAKQIALWVRSSQTVAFVAKSFAVTEAAVENLSAAIRPLLSGFRDLASAILPRMVGITQSISDAASRFGAWLTKISQSGQALTWFNNALVVLKQLMTILTQLGGVVTSVFHAISASGGNVLGVFGQMLTSLNTFLKSAEGAKDLTNIFKGIAQIGQAASGAIINLLKALAPALATLAPGLTAVANGLKSAFVQPAFVSGLMNLGRALSTIMAAIAPLLPVIATLAGSLVNALSPAIAPLAKALQGVALALGASLGAAIKALAPSIPPLAAALATVVSSLSPFIALIGPIATALGPFVEAAALLLKALSPLAPIIIGVVAAIRIWAAAQLLLDAAMDANPIGLVVIAIAALVAGILYAWKHFSGFRDAVMAVWDALKISVMAVFDFIKDHWQLILAVILGPLGIVIGLVIKYWRQIYDAIATAVTATINFVKQHWQLILGIVLGPLGIMIGLVIKYWRQIYDGIANTLTGIYNFVKNVLKSILDIWTSVWNLFTTIVSSVWNIIHAIIFGNMNDVYAAIHSGNEKIKAAWEAVWNSIKAFVMVIWNGIKNGITNIYNGIVNGVTNAWNNIKNNTVSAWNNIKNATTATWNAIKSFFVSMWNGLRNTFDSALNGIKSGISSAWNWLRSTTSSAWNGIVSAVRSAVSSMMGTVRNIPGDVRNAIGNLGSLLYNAGRSIIQGLINGIVSMVGPVKNAIGNVLSQARNLLPFSPAKEGPFSGKGWTTFSGASIVEGLIKGMEGNSPALKASLKKMATDAKAGLNTIAGQASLNFHAATTATLGAGGTVDGISGSITIQNLTIKLDANIDLSKGVPLDIATRLKDAIRQVERSRK